MIALGLAMLALAFLTIIASCGVGISVEKKTGSQESGMAAFLVTHLLLFTLAAFLAAHVINAR